MKRAAVILAGGAGTRLWPLSSDDNPKQFLQLFDGQSLLQLTFARAARRCPPEAIYVSTNELYARKCREHLPRCRRRTSSRTGAPQHRAGHRALHFRDRRRASARCTVVVPPLRSLHRRRAGIRPHARSRVHVRGDRTKSSSRSASSRRSRTPATAISSSARSSAHDVIRVRSFRRSPTASAPRSSCAPATTSGTAASSSGAPKSSAASSLRAAPDVAAVTRGELRIDARRSPSTTR